MTIEYEVMMQNLLQEIAEASYYGGVDSKVLGRWADYRELTGEHKKRIQERTAEITKDWFTIKPAAAPSDQIISLILPKTLPNAKCYIKRTKLPELPKPADGPNYHTNGIMLFDDDDLKEYAEKSIQAFIEQQLIPYIKGE